MHGRADRPALAATAYPTAELARRLVERLRPHARELGSEAELEGILDLIERGTGADRQLAEWRANRDMVALVRAIVEATAAPPRGAWAAEPQPVRPCSRERADALPVHRQAVLAWIAPTARGRAARHRRGAAPSPRSSARSPPARSAPAAGRLVAGVPERVRDAARLHDQLPGPATAPRRRSARPRGPRARTSTRPRAGACGSARPGHAAGSRARSARSGRRSSSPQDHVARAQPGEVGALASQLLKCILPWLPPATVVAVLI